MADEIDDESPVTPPDHGGLHPPVPCPDERLARAGCWEEGPWVRLADGQTWSLCPPDPSADWWPPIAEALRYYRAADGVGDTFRAMHCLWHVGARLLLRNYDLAAAQIDYLIPLRSGSDSTTDAVFRAYFDDDRQARVYVALVGLVSPLLADIPNDPTDN